MRVTDVETFEGDSTTTMVSDRPLLPGGERVFATAEFLAPEKGQRTGSESDYS